MENRSRIFTRFRLFLFLRAGEPCVIDSNSGCQLGGGGVYLGVTEH
jgi:hypothetical protein